MLGPEPQKDMWPRGADYVGLKVVVLVEDGKGDAKWRAGKITVVPKRERRKAQAPQTFTIQLVALPTVKSNPPILKSLDFDEYGCTWFTVIYKSTVTPCPFGENCVQPGELLFASDQRPIFLGRGSPHTCKVCQVPLHNLCNQAYWKEKRGPGDFQCPQCISPRL